MVGKIVKVEQLNENVRSFYFKASQSTDYLAGQYVDIKLPGVDLSHWYTLSSSPTEEHSFFTTVFTDHLSEFKQALLNLKPGDEFNYSEAFGDYVLPKDPKIPLIFIAGGIGITPVRSVIKYLTDNDDQRQVELFYCVKYEDGFIFESILDAYPMNYIPVVTRPHSSWKGQAGQLTANRVVDLSKFIEKDPMVFISGPQTMVENLTDELSRVVSRQRIIMDYFPGYLELL
jgi:ferredoxin-NADP reductase